MATKPKTTPRAKKAAAVPPQEEKWPAHLKFVTETEMILAEELRFLPQPELFYNYVILLSHLRDMFESLPKSHTIGKLRRFLPDDPDKDREGPMVAKLRTLVEP